MIRNRRVAVWLPEDWVQEIDNVARSRNMARSDLIREATRRYLLAHRRVALRRELAEGYVAMGPLNLALASGLEPDTPETFAEE